MSKMKNVIALLLMICFFATSVNAFSNEIMPTATSRPTTECPDDFYEHDFSGTRNYTYSDYYWKHSSIIITADSKFEVKTYKINGSYLHTFTPNRDSDGTYSLNFVNSGCEPYYFVVYNRSSSPMKNARYEAYKEAFCPYKYLKQLKENLLKF